MGGEQVSTEKEGGAEGESEQRPCGRYRVTTYFGAEKDVLAGNELCAFIFLTFSSNFAILVSWIVDRGS